MIQLADKVSPDQTVQMGSLIGPALSEYTRKNPYPVV